MEALVGIIIGIVISVLAAVAIAIVAFAFIALVPGGAAMIGQATPE